MTSQPTQLRTRETTVRPRFGLAGAALLTAICVAALALTGSGPAVKSADAETETASQRQSTPAADFATGVGR